MNKINIIPKGFSVPEYMYKGPVLGKLLIDSPFNRWFKKNESKLAILVAIVALIISCVNIFYL